MCCVTTAGICRCIVGGEEGLQPRQFALYPTCGVEVLPEKRVTVTR